MSCGRPAMMKTTNSAPIYCSMKDMASLPPTSNEKKSDRNQKYGYKYTYNTNINSKIVIYNLL